MLARALAGAAVAVLVALLARRARALSPSGAVAAAIVGTLAIAAGWGWGALLVLYFVLSSALSRLGARRKERLLDGVVEKGGERDATQVLANGLVFAAAAALFALRPDATLLAVIGAGALAASAADTWATEIGTLLGGTPRSLLGFRPLAPGLSGGVTLAGTLASVAGALVVAALAVLLGWPAAAFAPVAAGGVAGSLADSLLGAAVQERRRCPRCGTPTERRVHDCGTTTVHAGGLERLGNDGVNLLASLAGAAVAGAWAAW